IARPQAFHFVLCGDPRYFFDAGIWGSTAGTTSRCRVRNGDDPAPGPIDLLDTFYARASRHQVCAFDEIICWAKINALCTLGVLRHERKIAVTFRDRVRNLAGIVIDLKSERQFQRRRKPADQIDGNALNLSPVIPDRKKGGCRGSRNDAATQRPCGSELFEIRRAGHAGAFSTAGYIPLWRHAKSAHVIDAHRLGW